MVRDVLRGHVGLDILAVVAMVATLAVGEYVAALIIVLMLSGGEALEDFAGRRAKKDLSALLDRSPRTAHILAHPHASDSLARMS
jgi:cation transport ATPase